MKELYLCYCSEITGAAFATKKIDANYELENELDYDEFIYTREECEEEKVYSRIEGFEFDWEKIK
jgi:hypothetical protein